MRSIVFILHKLLISKPYKQQQQGVCEPRWRWLASIPRRSTVCLFVCLFTNANNLSDVNSLSPLHLAHGSRNDLTDARVYIVEKICYHIGCCYLKCRTRYDMTSTVLLRTMCASQNIAQHICAGLKTLFV